MDDVIIAFNESATHGFQEDFNSFQNDVWYMAMNAVPKITCQSKNNALEFSKNGQESFLIKPNPTLCAFGIITTAYPDLSRWDYDSRMPKKSNLLQEFQD